MNESKVVRYFPSHRNGMVVAVHVADEDTYVTHADYKALEEEVLELRQGAYEDTETITMLDAELASLKARVRELVEADVNFDAAKKMRVAATTGDECWKSECALMAAADRRRLALEALS